MHVRPILKQDACLLWHLSIYCSFSSDTADWYTPLLTHMSFMRKTNTVRTKLPCITSGRNKIENWAPKIRTQATQMDVIFYVQLRCTLTSLHFANTWVRCRHPWHKRMDTTRGLTQSHVNSSFISFVRRLTYIFFRVPEKRIAQLQTFREFRMRKPDTCTINFIYALSDGSFLTYSYVVFIDRLIHQY